MTALSAVAGRSGSKTSTQPLVPISMPVMDATGKPQKIWQGHINTTAPNGRTISGQGPTKIFGNADKTDSSTDQKANEVFVKKIPVGGYSSDDELPAMDTSIAVFSKKETQKAEAMTIPFKDKDGKPHNIKGSTLIEIVHDQIQEFYEEVTDLATQYEKDIDGTVIPPPSVLDDGTVFINHPREWLMTLGGWKGMAPKEETRGYFLFSDSSKRFTAARIFDNPLTFLIVDHRVHIPKGFSIGKFDVTTKWEKQANKWTAVTGKTDLSYNQVSDAIKHMKKSFGLKDADVATIQLSAVGRHLKLPKDIWGKTPKENQREIEQFLDYVNALMFGIEPSGLNAALVVSLMTLELIAEERLSYETAFKANEDGGVYPYASFGTNKGSYNERERILLHAKTQRSPLSMKTFRENPSLSPVATKEAIVIKTWLAHRQVIDPKGTYDEQITQIKSAISSLYSHYLGWGMGEGLIKRFAVMGLSDDHKEGT